MRFVDVNVLVHAHRPDSEHHSRYREWLDAARRAPEPLGLGSVVASGFLRVVTNPRVFRDPTPIDIALGFIEALGAGPATLAVDPGERHWSIFSDLCRRVNAKGNIIPDAYLAAVAIEHGATLVTADRGYGRFPGLRWEHPLED
jgi:hypothetical protein